MKILIMIATILLAANVFAAEDTLRFTWTATGDDGNVGTAAGYDLRYSTAPITDANWAAATPITAISTKVPLVAGSAESFQTILTGLGSQTLYYFSIKARDEANNWGGASTNKQFTTRDNIAPSVIILIDVVRAN